MGNPARICCEVLGWRQVNSAVSTCSSLGTQSSYRRWSCASPSWQLFVSHNWWNTNSIKSYLDVFSRVLSQRECLFITCVRPERPVLLEALPLKVVMLSVLKLSLKNSPSILSYNRRSDHPDFMNLRYFLSKKNADKYFVVPSRIKSSASKPHSLGQVAR